MKCLFSCLCYYCLMILVGVSHLLFPLQAEENCASCFEYRCYPKSDRDLSLGVKLETEFWNLVKNEDIQGFSDKLSPIFQGDSANGTYSRQQQIEGLASLTIDSFQIVQPVVTRFSDVLVITYQFYAVGQGIVSGPSLTTWKKKKSNGHWKIISHAYFPFPY